MSNVPLSGAQFSLRNGDYEAEIATVGATLRVLRHRGRDIVVPFIADQLRPAMRGALLLPWPNRTRDGRYEFDGIVHQLPINEPETRSAAHGLVAWLLFQPLLSGSSALRLGATLEPQPGYPWRLHIMVDLTLSKNGLTQEVTVTNLSDATAPVGIGGHPYLLAGPVGPEAIDGWELHIPADEVLLVSEERMLPTQLVRVDSPVGAPLDFRRPQRLEGVVLNNAYTSLQASADGDVRIRVCRSGGSGVELECDGRTRWVQVYTSDAAPGGARRHAVAVEPMTCPPDAFNSAVDLDRVPSGGSTGLGWTIRAVL